MARIAGVDIPREKRIEISLTYVFGIGRSTAQQVCEASKERVAENRAVVESKERLVAHGEGDRSER